MNQLRKSYAMYGITLFILVIGANVNGYSSDFPGPYCRTRPGGCCESREDSCSVPISSELTQYSDSD